LQHATEERVEVADWGRRTAFVAGSIFLLTSAFVAVKTARDALYFQADGLFDLPKAYLGITLFSLPLAAVMLELMHHFGARHARIIANLGFALLLLLFAPFARPGGGVVMTLFFILVPLVFGVLFSVSWLLGADLLARAPRKRLAKSYGQIGAASLLGGMLGAGLGSLCARHVDPQALIALGALLLACVSGMQVVTHRRYPVQRLANSRDPGRPGPMELLAAGRDRYTQLLVLIATATALVGVLIEFQFYMAAATSGQSGRENMQFFSSVYFVVSLIGLVVQIQVMPWVQNRIGIQRSLLILPSVLLGAASALLFSSAVALRTLLRITEGGLKSSIHRANWEQAYIALPPIRRPVAKLLVDGAGARLGEGLAAGMLQIWLSFVVMDRSLAGLDVRWVTAVLLVAVIVWIAITRSIGWTLTECLAVAGEAEERLDIPLPDT
jgi:hypothetical protein